MATGSAKPLHGPREQVCLTPAWLYDLLNAKFGPFDFDPAPHPRPPAFDGLSPTQPWGKRNYLNPPFAELEGWATRAITELGDNGNETLMLGPFRPHQKWWHHLIAGKWPTYPVLGYLRFKGYEQDLPQSMVCVWFTRRPVTPPESAGQWAILRPVDVMRIDQASAAAAAAAPSKKKKVTHAHAEAEHPGAFTYQNTLVFRGPTP